MGDKGVALFGGSFNPPSLQQRQIAARLAELFDELVVVPCGPRPDKPVTNDVPTIHRATMVDMTFRGLEGVSTDLFDLENPVFTRTHELERRFAHRGPVWHVVIGAEMLHRGGAGAAKIQREWRHGAELWQQARFAVVTSPDQQLAEEDLPPQHQRLALDTGATAETIRERAFARRSISGMVTDEVGAYIDRHGLYRGMQPASTTSLVLSELRPHVICDQHSDRALALADTLGAVPAEEANLIVAIGGDGTMLRAVRQQWRRRLPFYGINTGHSGFLLNDSSPREHLGQPLTLEQLPLLRVETTGPEGAKSALAFNDAWVERATGQTAWLQVTVDGQRRLARLVADGALIATAAGSTSYARAMGASPMPMNTAALLLVGSNVLKPDSWRPVVLPQHASVELTTLDPDKRPLLGYVDGVPQGEVHALRARVSNIAAVELAYGSGHHPAERLAQIQFPLPE